MIAGLDANNTYATVTLETVVRYYSCFVYRANASLAYFELVDNTVFESS